MSSLKADIAATQAEKIPDSMTSVVSVLGEMDEQLKKEAKKHNVTYATSVSSAGPDRFLIQIWIGERPPSKPKSFLEK